MKNRVRILNKVSLVLVVLFVMTISVGAQASADQIDDALATSFDPTVTLVPACNGIPKATQIQGLQLIKSVVCSKVVGLFDGTQTGSSIGYSIQYLYLQLQQSLTPLCSGSLMVVFAQKVVDGSLSAGSCPAGN